MHVLIADDEELVRLTLRYMLEDEGHQVTEAGNGEEAFRRVAGEGLAVDALITDIIMPGRAGIGTIEALRAACPDLWIIAISGGGSMGNKDLLALAREAGADRVLAKPFSKQKLMEMLEPCPTA